MKYTMKYCLSLPHRREGKIIYIDAADLPEVKAINKQYERQRYILIMIIMGIFIVTAAIAIGIIL